MHNKEHTPEFVEDELSELIAMIDDPRKAPKRLASSNLREHAHKTVITKRADVERNNKHVTITTDHHSLIFDVERNSYSGDAPISVTTTQVDNLTYVVLSGDRFNSMQNDSCRFIFESSEYAENFRRDLILAVTSKTFVKSGHLISALDSENEVIDESSSDQASLRNQAKDWLKFVIYGLTTCGIVLVGATAVGFGWKLASSFF